MKKDEKKKEELQSRREFFKKAAKAALPVVGAVVLSQIPANAQYHYGSGVHAVRPLLEPVDLSCNGGCSSQCYGSCKGSCGTQCENYCEASCTRKHLQRNMRGLS